MIISVKPHMTKVACFLPLQPVLVTVPLLERSDSVAVDTVCTQPQTADAIMTARRRVSTANVLVLLVHIGGTFASNCNLAFADKDFNNLRMK